MVVAFAPTITMPAAAWANDEGGSILSTTTDSPCTNANGNCKYEVMKTDNSGTHYTHYATLKGAYDASGNDDLVRSVTTKQAIHLKTPGYDNSGITGIGTEDDPWVLHNYVKSDNSNVGYWESNGNTTLWSPEGTASNRSGADAINWTNDKSGALVSYSVDSEGYCSLTVSGGGVVPNYNAHDTYGDWRQLPWYCEGGNGLWTFYTGRNSDNGPQELTVSIEISSVGGLTFAFNRFKTVDIQGVTTTFAAGSLGMYKNPYGFDASDPSTKRQVKCWKSNFSKTYNMYEAFNGWSNADGKTLDDHVNLKFHSDEAEAFVKSYSTTLAYGAETLTKSEAQDVKAMEWAHEKLDSTVQTELANTCYGERYAALVAKAGTIFDASEPSSLPCSSTDNYYGCLYEVVHNADGKTTYSHYKSLKDAYAAVKGSNEEVRSVADNSQRSLTQPNETNQGVTGIGTEDCPWILHNKNSKAENSWNNEPSGTFAYVKKIGEESNDYQVVFDGKGSLPTYSGDPFSDAWAAVPWATGGSFAKVKGSWSFYAPDSSAKITSALVKEGVSSVNNHNFTNCDSLVELEVESPFTKLTNNACALLTSRTDQGVVNGTTKFKLVCWPSNLPGTGSVDQRIGLLFSTDNGYILQDDVQNGKVDYTNHINYKPYSDTLEKFIKDNEAAWSLDPASLDSTGVASVLRLMGTEAALAEQDKSEFRNTIYKAKFDALVGAANCFELSTGVFGCASSGKLTIDGNGAVLAYAQWSASAKNAVNKAGSITSIAVGGGILKLEEGAFAGFDGDVTVSLGDNTAIVGRASLPAVVTLEAHYGSCAHRYAKAEGLKFKASGKLRVLFIGNSHTERTFETVDNNSAGYDLVAPVLTDLGVADDVEYELIWSGARQLFSSDYSNGTYGNHKAELSSDKYRSVVDKGWDVVVIQDFKESDRMDNAAFKTGLANMVSGVKSMLPSAYIAWYSDFVTSDGSYDKAKSALDTVNGAIQSRETNMPDFAIATSAFVNNAAGILGSKIDDGLHLLGPQDNRGNKAGSSQWDYAAGCFLWASVLDWFGIGDFSSYVDKVSGTGGDQKRLNAGADLAAAKKAMLAAHEGTEPVSGYTVKFDVNGLIADLAAIAGVKYDATITIPDSLEATGYAFGGWFKDKDCQTAWTSTDKVQGDMTLYAKWTANKYTVQFNANGGAGTMQAQEFTFGTPQNLTANAFKRDGYTFAGWKINNNGDLIADKLNMSNLTTTNNGVVMLYAQWTPNKYTVTFDANGHGTAPAAMANVEYNTAIAVPTAPTASGYTFGGWFKDAACTQAWDFTADNVTGDTTLYAKWTRNSTGGGTYVPTPTPKPDPTPTPDPDQPQAPAKGDVVTTGTGTGQLSFAVTNVAGASGKGGTVSFAGCNGSATSVDVPATIEVGGVTYAVTEIAPYAFKGASELEKVTMPGTITKVGKGAFESCKRLKNVTIGTGVKSIGKNAFKGCKHLTSITVTSKHLSKKAVKGCLKGSAVKTVVVKVGTPKANKGYAKKYAKLFTKKVAGKKATVKASKKALKK